MLWFHVEFSSWVVGVTVDVTCSLHIGPVKIAWIPKGTQLHQDFQRLRKQRGKRQ